MCVCFQLLEITAKNIILKVSKEQRLIIHRLKTKKIATFF